MKFVGTANFAYVAGLLDADGSLTLSRRRKNGLVCFVPMGSIANQERQVLEDCKDTWGGSVCLVRQTSKRNWRWTCCGLALFRLLSDITPYLRIKRGESVMLQEFVALRDDTRPGPGRHGFRRLSPEQVALREGFYLALREAKKQRGL
jgi:hypothetical protein